MERHRAKLAGDGSAEGVEGRCRIGLVKPFGPSKGDGTQRWGVAGVLGIATGVKGQRAGWLMGFYRGGGSGPASLAPVPLRR